MQPLRPRQLLHVAGELLLTELRDLVREAVPDRLSAAGMDHELRQDRRLEERHPYFEADSAAPTAAWPAARRAVSTRNGEQLT